MTEKALIKACKEADYKAQKFLYEKFSSRFFGVCKRYLKNHETAEDVLVKGFMKIFSNINSYEGHGSFEGWMRKIMVNECLMELRRSNNLHQMVDIENVQIPVSDGIYDKINEQDVLKLLDLIPIGCRTVFNLYVIEGYKHSEIGEMLQISEGTSKSQLNLAKQKLKILLAQHGLLND